MSGLSVSSQETSPTLAAIVGEIGDELPGYREHTSPDGMLTLAFTDIEGSTEMMERLGEDRFFDVMYIHNKIVRSCVLEFGGDVVKSQGDGYLIAFRSASAALDFAVELQHLLDRHNTSEPAQPLRVRVGMHTGNIFQLDDDFLGRAVVLAARITGRARGGEILVSAACREYTRHVGRWQYGRMMELRLKGLAAPETVYCLEWTTSGAPER